MVRLADRPGEMAAGQWTAIDGLRIRFVEDAGRQGPDILVLSPWPQGMAAYRDCWPQLLSAGRVVALDLPGFGASEGRGDLASPRAMGAFLVKAIARFRLRHPHLVAPGLWWTLAADVSLAEPGRLDSLILGQDVIPGARDLPPTRGPTRRELEHELRSALAAVRVPDARRHEILRAFAGSRFRLVSAYLRAHRAAARDAAAVLSSELTPVLTIEGGGAPMQTGPTGEPLPGPWPPIGEDAPVRRWIAWVEAPEAFGQVIADWVSAEHRQVRGLAFARVVTGCAHDASGGGPDGRSQPPSVALRARV